MLHTYQCQVLCSALDRPPTSSLHSSLPAVSDGTEAQRGQVLLGVMSNWQNWKVNPDSLLPKSPQPQPLLAWKLSLHPLPLVGNRTLNCISHIPARHVLLQGSAKLS